MSAVYDEEGGKVLFSQEKLEQSKKNVLLLGDSIRMGYCEFAKEYLDDIANVRFPDENCRCTQYTYMYLNWWKDLCGDPQKVDLVYWNNGHWDVAHWGGDAESLNSPEQYSEMIVRIYNRIRKLMPNAKVVFATTTPMNPNGAVGTNPRTTEEIRHYNACAVRALEGKEVLVDDVFSLFEHKPSSFYRDYCHLTADAFAEMGQHVADFIRRTLVDQ